MEHLNILYIAFNGENISLLAYHPIRTPRTQLKNVVMLSPLCAGRQLSWLAVCCDGGEKSE